MIPLSYLRRIVSAKARLRLATSKKQVAVAGLDRRFAFENLEDRTTPTTNWIAFGDGINWSDSGNWDNGVPSGANDAVIGSGFGTIVYSAAAGTTSVTGVNSQSNLSFTGGSLTVTTAFSQTGTLNIAGGTLNVSTTSSVTGNITASTGTFSSTGALTAGGSLTNSGATVTLTGGGSIATNFSATGGTTSFGNSTTITGSATLNGGDVGGTGGVTVTGLTTLTAGTMSSGGSWSADGGTTINPGSSYSINGRTYIMNGGTNAWSSGDIFLSNAAVLRVASGQTLTASAANRTIGRLPASGSPSVDVQGTLTKSGAGSLTVDTAVAFNINGGTVNHNVGTLSLKGGGAATGAGALVGAASTTVDFNAGTYTYASTTSISGAGAATYSGGAVTVNGTYNLTGGFTVSGGSVTMSSTATVTSIGTTLAVSGGTATFNQGAGLTVTTFNLTGGTASIGATAPLTVTTFTQNGSSQLAGAGSVTVSGVTTFSSGTQTGAGTTQANGTLTLDTATGRTLDGGRILNVAATGNWTGGTINLNNGSQLVVQATGTLNATSNDAITRTSGSGIVSVAGIFNKNTGTGVTLVDLNVAFNNSGAVNVNAGTLRLGGGGAATGTAQVNVAAATTIDFSGGTYTFANTTTIAGAGSALFSGAAVTINGTYNVTGGFTVTGGSVTMAAGAIVSAVANVINVSGGTATFNQGAALAVTTVNLTGGTISNNVGTPITVSGNYTQNGSSTLTGAGDVTVLGTMTFSSGTMSGSGHTYANGAAVLDTANSKTLDGRFLQLFAAGTWSGGTIFANNSAEINVQGSLSATSNDSVTRSSGSGSVVIGGTGTFSKNTGTGVTKIDSQVSLQNNGTVNVNTGTLQIAGGGSSSGPINLATATTLDLNGGSFSIAGTSTLTGTGTGAVLNSGATTTVDGTYSLSATGSTTVTGGTLTLNAAATVTPATGLGGTVAASNGTANFNNGEAVTITTVNLTSNGNMNFGTGTDAAVTTYNQSGTTQLGGVGNVTVSGVTTFSSGTMTGASQTIANGALNIGGGSSVSITGGRTLLANATGTWSSGDIILDSAGVLSIGATGTLNATGDNFIKRFTFSGTGTVSNAGTFAKTGGAGNTTIDTAVTFNSTNIVNINSGTLVQQGLGTNSGTFNVAATKELRYNGGSYLHNSTSTVAGAGTVRFSGGSTSFDGTYNVTGNITVDGGTATFNPASTVVAVGPTLNASLGSITFNNGEGITITTLNLSGGSATFSGSSPATVTTFSMTGPSNLSGTSDVTVSGTTTWTGGTMSGSGVTQLNGAATINGASSVSLNGRPLNIGANSTWSGGTIFADGGAVLTVQATFTLTITGNNSYSRFSGSGTSQIVVAATATLVKSTGVGTTTVDNFTTTTNNGTIRVSTGTLDLAGGLTNFAGSTLTGGTYDVTGVFKFNSANIVTNSATIILNTSTSDIQATGGAAGSGLANFATNSATGSFTETGNKSLTVPSNFTNSGTFVLGVGSSFLTTAGTFTNNGIGITTVNGTLDPSSTVFISAGTLNGTGTVQSNTLVNGTGNVAPGTSPGVLNVVGNIVFSGSSTLTMEINGLTVGTQYDQLNVTGTVTLTSVTLVTSGSITAAIGNSVTLINNDLADPISGAFTGLANGSTVIVNGQPFIINYAGGSGNDVTLTLDNAPTDIQLSGSLIVTSFSPTNTLVGNLTGTDVDVPPDTLTFSMQNSAGGRFKVVGTQVLVDNGALLDSTVNSSHNITVRVTDSFGAVYDEVFTITVVPKLKVNSVGPVTPDPRNTTVSTIDVVLNQPADLLTFDFNDLTLTLNAGPNLITGSVTVSFVSGTTYQIGGLTGLTAAEGTYVLTVDATTVLDLQGIAGIASGTSSDTWVMDTTAPTITTVEVITPDPRNTQVTTWDVTFSEAINLATLTAADFTFTAGGPNLLTGSESVTFVSGTTYRISGLPAQGLETTYTLTLDASGVQDPAGNSGIGSSNDSFTRDTVGPTITSVEVITPDPRNTQVTTWDVTFSEAINLATLTSADFTFTAGGPNLLTGSESVTFVSGTTYRISGLPAQGLEATYTLTINASGVQDPAGNSGIGSSNDSFTRDTVGPTITSVEVITPDPRNTQVTTWDVTFSEAVNLATLTSADFTLTAGGPNLLTGSETVALVSGTTYRISGLPAQSTDGTYTLTIDATGVQDLVGNAGTGSSNDSFVRDTANPIVTSVEIVSPDPRNTQLTQWDVTLSEVIDLATMTSADFRFFEPGPTNILTGAETVSFVSGTTYRISGLPAQTIDGIHQLNIVLFGVQDLAGNSGANIGVDTFVRDTVGPTITSVEVITPDPRNTAVSTWDVTFSEALDLASITAADFTLTAGGPNLLTGSESVTFVSGTTYRISGLAPLTGTAGTYTLTIDASGVADPAGNAGTGSSSDSWTFATDTTAPTITALFLNGFNWTANFRTAAGDPNFGYPAQTGAGQLTPVPWSTINWINVTFSEPVVGGLTVGQVGVRGVNVATYTVSSITTISATEYRINLSAPIDTDWLIVQLDGSSGSALQDAAGNKLAGTFTENVSTFPTSGPAGVDFKYRFKVAVGDANRDGIVRNADKNLVTSNLFVDFGSAGYNIFADIDTNGIVRNADKNIVSSHLFVDAPTGGGPTRPRGSATGGSTNGRHSGRLGQFTTGDMGSSQERTSSTPRRFVANHLTANVIDEIFGDLI